MSEFVAKYCPRRVKKKLAIRRATAEGKGYGKVARRDMRNAQILHEHGGDSDAICYFCQQATEKYLKGFLLKHTTVNLDLEGHNLVKLCKKAVLYDRSLESFCKECTFLNTFYVETRYPQEDPLIIDENDVQECLRIADELMDHIDRVLPK